MRSIDLSGAKILVVDDAPSNLDLLSHVLEGGGYEVSIAPRGEVALRLVRGARPDLILLDVRMPDIDGFEVCRRLKGDVATRDIPVVYITAHGQTEEIVQGFESGGVDYILKPFRKEEVLVRVRTHLENARLAQMLAEQNEALRAEMARREAVTGERNRLANRLSALSSREAERWGIAGFVGKSGTMQTILKSVETLQNAEATSALVMGESGTGKELVARAIHFGSRRAEGPFVPLNCGTIPMEMAESLLFGHVRGAFTGADREQVGYFELADGGTLFLDEVGEMPVDVQVKLLRVLEDGQVLPLGARQGRSVDVRILAATNADLRDRMTAGAFRQDLYFRLARFTVYVPPLRERKEDIPLLAEHFLRLFSVEMGRETPGLSQGVLEALDAYDFPGNIRELKNMMERALLECNGADEIGPHHLQFLDLLPATGAPTPAGGASGEIAWPDFERLELEQIKQALTQTRGNIVAAARLLGTNRMRIYRLLRKYNLTAG